MSRTLFFVLILIAAWVAPPPSRAAPAGDAASVFAVCAGRYLAEAEHLSLFDGAASRRAEAVQARFDALARAAAPWEEAATLRHVRAEARLVQRGLLEQARFGTDARRRATAGDAAATLRAHCDGLILGS